MDKDEELKPQMPDLAARQPAEGDLDFPTAEHLCCTDREISTEEPVESGALGEVTTEEERK